MNVLYFSHIHYSELGQGQPVALEHKSREILNIGKDFFIYA